MITPSNFESNIAETLASIAMKEEMKKWDTWAASHSDRAGYEAWDVARKRDEYTSTPTLSPAKQKEKEEAREMWKDKGYWLEEHGWCHTAPPDHPVFKDYFKEGKPLTKEEVWQAIGEERLEIGQAVEAGHLTLGEAILGLLRFEQFGKLAPWQIVLCWMGTIFGLILFAAFSYLLAFAFAIVFAAIVVGIKAGLGSIISWIKNL